MVFSQYQKQTISRPSMVTQFQIVQNENDSRVSPKILSIHPFIEKNWFRFISEETPNVRISPKIERFLLEARIFN